MTTLQAPAETGVARHSALLAVSAGLVGVLSYLCTLVMAHLLPAVQYTQYAAAQMLVGIVGIVAHVLVPLPLAALVSRYGAGAAGRRDGMAFATLVSMAAGVVAGLLTGGITAAFAPAPVAVATGLASLVLCVVAPAQGWLQGELRFTRYAVASILEVGLRLGFSVAAVLLGWGPAGALLGFAVGGVALVAGPLRMLRDVTWRPAVLRERVRWAETGDIALVQFVVSVLVGADVVLVALLGSGTDAEAGFQALATLAKGPVYVASGTVLVAFPLLRAARSGDGAFVLRTALHSFTALALAAAAVLATVPTALVASVLPAPYVDSVRLLPALAVAGVGYGAVTVLATVLLALRLARRTHLGLVAATAVMATGLVVGWTAGGVTGLAVGAAAGATAATVALGVLVAPVLPAGTAGDLARDVAIAAVLIVVLMLAQPLPPLWLACAAVGGLLALRPDLARELVRRSRRSVR